MRTWMRAAAVAGLLAAGAAPLAAPAAAWAQPQPAAAEDAFRATTLNLSAYGETRAAPDMATISLGVTTDAPQAAAAMAANARQMSQVIAALKRGGVAERDIQTSQISLDPQYAYDQNQPPRLTGYRAADQLSVTVRDLARLGAAVDAVVGAGANQVGSISFGLSNPTAAEDAARELAVKALAAKADLYARATGYRVVRLVNLGEGGASIPPPPMPMVAMSARFEKAATPVSPGELRVRVDVNAVYELAR
jgi:uncharacterized protein YggE